MIAVRESAVAEVRMRYRIKSDRTDGNVEGIMAYGVTKIKPTPRLPAGRRLLGGIIQRP